MEQVLAEFVEKHLVLHVVLIAVAAAAILGAMALDFWSGLRKAKQRGEATTSRGLKKTAAKASKYYTPFMALVFIDLICCVVIPWPVFSMLWAGYCVFCEFKSVREKSWQKAEIQKAERTMRLVVENKDDLLQLASELIFDKEKDSSNHSNACGRCESPHPNCCKSK